MSERLVVQLSEGINWEFTAQIASFFFSEGPRCPQKRPLSLIKL
jgi:hypothetical protein